MQHAIFRKILAVLFGLVLTATGLWASPAGEEEPAAAMEKEMVTDPTTGKVVTAPEYGGTLTYPYVLAGENSDPFVVGGSAVFLIGGVNENLARPNWGLPREEFAFNGPTFLCLLSMVSWRKAGKRPTPLRTYSTFVRTFTSLSIRTVRPVAW